MARTEISGDRIKDTTVDLTVDITNTLPVGNGGTGAVTLTGLVKGNGASPFTAVAAPSGAVVGDTDTQTVSGKTLSDTFMGEVFGAPKTQRDTTLTASQDFLVVDALEVAAAYSLEIPATTTLEIICYITQSTQIVEYAGTTTVSGVAVPAGVKGARLTVIGAGCGGGSGRQGLTSTVRCGGGGAGSAGAVYDHFVPKSVLGSTYAVTIPAGGAGGPAQAGASTDGNAGSIPAFTTFISGAYTLQCTPGDSGKGGTASTGTGGGFGGVGTSSGTNGGAASVTGGVGAVGGDSLNGAPSGGGAGGGLTSGNAAANGGVGGTIYLNNVPNLAGGVVGGATPGAGFAQAGTPGGGGGGGASTVSGAPQAGATPLGYGGGGGGGGASLNGNSSGAGGAGGPGYVRIEWIYV